jgi:hypothetical protein
MDIFHAKYCGPLVGNGRQQVEHGRFEPLAPRFRAHVHCFLDFLADEPLNDGNFFGIGPKSSADPLGDTGTHLFGGRRAVKLQPSAYDADQREIGDLLCVRKRITGDPVDACLSANSCSNSRSSRLLPVPASPTIDMMAPWPASRSPSPGAIHPVLRVGQ